MSHSKCMLHELYCSCFVTLYGLENNVFKSTAYSNISWFYGTIITKTVCHVVRGIFSALCSKCVTQRAIFSVIFLTPVGTFCSSIIVVQALLSLSNRATSISAPCNGIPLCICCRQTQSTAGMNKPFFSTCLHFNKTTCICSLLAIFN